jgi:hypothetical protein
MCDTLDRDRGYILIARTLAHITRQYYIGKYEFDFRKYEFVLLIIL